MIKGKFYAVGVGPGDPDLISLKAIKTIEKCDVIALPVSGGKNNMALDIGKPYITNQELLHLDMPMIKDGEKLRKFHRKAADTIGSLLDEGRNVAFLTLGDPTVYSTVMYVHKFLTDDGHFTEVIPGITSFCAGAAALNITLCEKDEMLHIVPATFTDLKQLESLPGTKVLMKSGKTIGKVIEEFRDSNAMLVENATMKNQRIFKDLSEIKEDTGYFSLVYLKDEK